MRGRVSADPDRLEDYTAETVPRVLEVFPAVDDHRRALQRLNEAPNDLRTSYIDPTAAISAELDLLRELDRSPAALAFALRNLDVFRSQQGVLSGARFGELDLLGALSSAYLASPNATEGELVAQATNLIDTSVRWPWDDGVGPWLSGEVGSGSFWTTTTIGAALGTVIAVDEQLITNVAGYTRASGTQVAGYQRWKTGYATRMNRIMSASTLRSVAPWVRMGSRSLPFVGAAGIQLYEDHGDPTLTTGDRIARTGAATVVEGGFAFGGAWGGATVGALALSWAAPPIGPIVGGVVGGAIGGFIGSQVGGIVLDNLSGAIESAGRAIDSGLDAIGSVASSVGTSVSNAASAVGSAASDAASSVGSAASNAASAVGSAASDAASSVAAVGGSVADGAASLASGVISTGANTGGALLDGIGTAGGAVTSTVAGWFGG